MSHTTRTIAVIDGDAARRDRIIGAIDAAGHRAIAIGEDDDAIARIDAEEPALILIAWAAPLVRGVQLFDALAAEPRRARIPVVVLAEDATASRVPSHAAAVLGHSARTRTLLDVIVRLTDGPADEATALRHRLLAKTVVCRVVSRTLVDVDSAGAEAEADTMPYVEDDQATAGPT